MKNYYLTAAAVLTFILSSTSSYANGNGDVSSITKQRHESLSSESRTGMGAPDKMPMYGYAPSPIKECGAERWVILTVPENYFRSGDVLLPSVARPGDDFPPL